MMLNLFFPFWGRYHIVRELVIIPQDHVLLARIWIQLLIERPMNKCIWNPGNYTYNETKKMLLLITTPSPKKKNTVEACPNGKTSTKSWFVWCASNSRNQILLRQHYKDNHSSNINPNRAISKIWAQTG